MHLSNNSFAESHMELDACDTIREWLDANRIVSQHGGGRINLIGCVMEDGTPSYTYEIIVGLNSCKWPNLADLMIAFADADPEKVFRGTSSRVPRFDSAVEVA